MNKDLFELYEQIADIQYRVSLAFDVKINGKDIEYLSLVVDATIDHRLYQAHWDKRWFDEAKEFAELCDALLD